MIKTYYESLFTTVRYDLEILLMVVVPDGNG